MKKNRWIAIGAAIFILLGGFGFFVCRLFFFNNDDVKSENSFVPVETAQKIIDENKPAIEQVKPVILSSSEIYTKMHQMANTLIIADQIRGKLEINKKNIIETMAQINNSAELSDSNKQELLNILNRWQKKDFSCGVEDHNYLWRLLDGQVGRATGLRSEYLK